MKRTRNINRNTTSYNFSDIRNNGVTPEILVNEIWMEEDDKCGVRIIELNSNDSAKESPGNYSNTWSNVQNTFEEIEHIEDRYVVNEEARRRRRMNLEQSKNIYEATFDQPSNQYYFDQNVQTDGNNLYENEAYDPDMNSTMNHQMNYFDFMKNPYAASESSTDKENYNAIEIIEINNSEDERYWDHVYNDDTISYNSENPAEKRTIWIYSYKNKRLLSDEHFELVNIPSSSSGTSTSCSISDEEKNEDKTTNTRRLGSPIAATYIPRLDLSLVQTLSTVTEISESNKSHSKNSVEEKISSKPMNNWLTERNDSHLQKSSNVVNWMALSPRERRRRSIKTDRDVFKENLNKPEITYAEGSAQLYRASVKSKTVEVQVDIHANEKHSHKEHHVTPNETKPYVTQPNSEIIDLPSDDNVIDDIYAKLNFSETPHINLHTNIRPIKSKITLPIETPASSAWIEEETLEKETAVHDLENRSAIKTESDSENADRINSSSGRLWKKSLQLMKPPEWMEYLPITASRPTSHLTISLSSLSSKKTWFKRLKQCINCCK